MGFPKTTRPDPNREWKRKCFKKRRKWPTRRIIAIDWEMNGKTPGRRPPRCYREVSGDDGGAKKNGGRNHRAVGHTHGGGSEREAWKENRCEFHAGKRREVHRSVGKGEKGPESDGRQFREAGHLFGRVRGSKRWGKGFLDPMSSLKRK